MTSRSGNLSGTSIKLVALFAFLAISFLVQPAGADTITFFDTTDTITVGQVGSQHNVSLFNTQTGLSGSCSATETYACDIFITSPTGATPTSPAMNLNISEAGVDPTLAVSDYVQAIPGGTSYLVLFASDSPGDPSNVLGLSPIPGPSISETGGVQTAFTLSWSDGTSDTIQFQSDTEVPEPASIILLGTGVLGLLRLRYCRRNPFRVRG